MEQLFNEKYFKSIVENIPNMVFIKDAKELRFVVLNKAGEDLLGYSKEELIGKNDYDFFPKSEADFFTRNDRKVLDGKILVDIIEEPIQTRLKGLRFLHTKKIPILNDLGQPVYLLGISEDITEKKYLQESLINAKKNLEQKVKERTSDLSRAKAKDDAILSSIGDGLIVTDIDGKIIMINKAFEQMLGYKKKEIVGTQVSKIITIKDKKGEIIPEKDCLIKKALSGKMHDAVTSSFLIDDRYFVRKDKTCFPIFCIISPIKDRKIIGAVGVFKDVTKEKELDNAKAEFLSLASHQLRTPLSGMKWILELFIKDKNITNQSKRRIIDLSILNERLINLVNELLNIARIETGKWPINKRMVDLNELIYNSYKVCKQNADMKNQKINISIKNKLEKVNLDQLLFEESINNILSNSINYSPKNSVININVVYKNNKYIISINNHGPVIPKNDQEKLFEKFHRGDHFKIYKSEGSGLGLYIAKKAIEINGGKIWFKSNRKTGTTFYFTVPLLNKNQ